MKIELAIVVDCDATGCHVNPLKGSESIKVRYSSLVQKYGIRIRPAHLVAVDVSANPPEIVWRWLRAAVIEVNADTVGVDDMLGHPATLSRVPDLPLTLALDDEVWFCGPGRADEVHDIIADRKPTHPNRLLEYIAPIIAGIYKTAVHT